MLHRLTLAGCVIKDVEGRILLIHRNTPKRVQWELPGGKVEAGESPEQAAVREIKEELGVEVQILTKMGEKEFKEDEFLNDYVWFEAEVLSGQPHPMEEKFDAIRFFHLMTSRESIDQCHRIYRTFLKFSERDSPNYLIKTIDAIERNMARSLRRVIFSL